jgi:hypothetical protein
VSSRPAPTSAPLLLRMLEERHHRDADDRPLCEVRTPPEHLRPGDLIHRACPYPGSRHGRPMNVAALAQMSSHWDDVVDTLAVLRTRYAAARPEAAPELLDVWRVSQFAASLPWFFLLRRDQADPGVRRGPGQGHPGRRPVGPADPGRAAGRWSGAGDDRGGDRGVGRGHRAPGR